MDNPIDVQVVYATPTQQQVVTLQVARGCTAFEAATLSRITESFPGLDLSQVRWGIFSRSVKPEQVLEAGDRVEIYRPLLVDPKESRRQRAREAKRQRDRKSP